MSDFKIVKLLDPVVQLNVNVNPRGNYNNSTVYSVGDLVLYNGLSYIANQSTVGNLPTDTNYWQIVVDISTGSNNWLLTGNTSVNPSTEFLGTTDSNPIKIRTNNNEIAQFDVNGRFGIGPDAPSSTFHIKPYIGYTGSGTQYDSFALTTSNPNLNNIYALTLTNNSIVRVSLEVMGRQSDGTQRVAFTRSGLFFKENANVAIQGKTWQSDLTSKSSSTFDIKYILGTNTVTFQVKAASATDTYWTGNIKFEVLKTDL
jgi:hypothetical protein